MDEPFENYRDFKSEIDTFRIENDNLKRDYEKVTIDYELKIEQLKKDIDLKTISYENLMINFQELDAKYRNSCQEKISINKEYFDLSQVKFNIVKKYDNLESEHTTLLELVSRLEKELLHTKNETQDLRVLLTEFKDKEIESKLNTNELEYRRKDFEQMEQISLLCSKKLLSDVKSLEEKLSEIVKANHEDKVNHNKVMYEMNLDLESKRNEHRVPREKDDMDGRINLTYRYIVSEEEEHAEIERRKELKRKRIPNNKNQYKNWNLSANNSDEINRFNKKRKLSSNIDKNESFRGYWPNRNRSNNDYNYNKNVHRKRFEGEIKCNNDNRKPKYHQEYKTKQKESCSDEVAENDYKKFLNSKRCISKG